MTQAYDHAGRRVLRSQGGQGVAYIYDAAGHLLAEHDASTGAVIREYIWLEGMVIAMVDGAPATPTYSFVHTGHLAEPLLVTDGSGAVVSSITRDPWGNAILLAGTAAIQLGYPGQWHDSTSGLYQNWNRDYDPTLGRYIETDPIGLAGGTNLYAYVGGNPVNWIDPEGLMGSRNGRKPPMPPTAPSKGGRGHRSEDCTPPPPPPPVDWCGSKGTEWVPDGTWPEACQAHDICYGTPGASKAACDLELSRDMAMLCTARGGNGTLCASIGAWYGLVLTPAGWPAYNAAQNGSRR